MYVREMIMRLFEFNFSFLKMNAGFFNMLRQLVTLHR